MPAVADRVQETTTTSGTGDITLAGAQLGYRRFQDAFANGTPVYYAITLPGTTEWEVGFGTLSAATTLQRTTVLASSNAGAAVNFSAGTKLVWNDAPAALLLAFARLDVEDQALTGGVIVTSKSLGTVSSGTVTPDPGDRPLQHYTNGGAHTLAPSANNGSVLVDITNNATAGAITTTGFTFVTGDAFTTTNGQKFRCHISIGNAGSLLQVQALQ